MHVRPHCRGRGVATALLGAAEELTRARGLGRIAVGVAEGNADAARLYGRLGYERTGVIDRSEYTWIDCDGVAHDAVELDELLVRDLC